MECEHKCGIVAIVVKNNTPRNLVPLLYQLLLNQQNRGQEGAGFCVYNPQSPQRVTTHKGLGTVDNVFRNITQEIHGTMAIGHVRYATSGKDDIGLVQPLIRQHGEYSQSFALCWNGNLTNLDDLILDYPEYHFEYGNDTELIKYAISKQLQKESCLNLAIQQAVLPFDGCFNIACLDYSGHLVVLRDSLGMRPVVYGENDDLLVVASESSALTNLNIGLKWNDLPPGYLLSYQLGIFDKQPYQTPSKKSLCIFELIYFANLASVIDGIPVFSFRENLAVQLALQLRRNNFPIDDNTVVCGVPETGCSIADRLSHELGIRTVEGLKKNPVHRTFIQGSEQRSVIDKEYSAQEFKIATKYNVVRDAIQGKRIILVDDSLVRGNTMRDLVKRIRAVGDVKEIHLVIVAPPIVAPCFYGIAMPTVQELFVPKYQPSYENNLEQETLNKVATFFGADSITFQTMEGLQNALAPWEDKKNSCFACMNKNYPTSAGQVAFEKALISLSQ